MNLTRDRMRSIGWAAVLLICLAFTVVLTFKVNAVKSQVRLAERQILSVKQDKLLLETEFETRANQQQLRTLNEVEFGYQAPAAGQYLESERQLAELSKPRAADAHGLEQRAIVEAEVPADARDLPGRHLRRHHDRVVRQRPGAGELRELEVRQQRGDLVASEVAVAAGAVGRQLQTVSSVGHGSQVVDAAVKR